ncbi:DUF1990 family protein [Cryptosporangium aurantiacum]|uniref:Uncharacterized protein, UPF0548 family n=1 Tax=Cryptosporangium aurantiacum TaxID=134849 RepID=A0A1M7RMR5_9ACTN|nr:DUF1990 domain-containing protein [Cryptosporangium aurantiacum]SHN47499.1 Uncharacterized protein, UPF0548 family [Cryptosporangium aurantiacum]
MAFSYPEVGAVARGERPPGYEHFAHRATLGGSDHFATAVDDLLAWRMHSRSGVGVTPSAPEAAPGVVLVQRFRVGPVLLVAPVRILEVRVDADRAVLIYGTLRGHPEQGEEQFVIERHADGSVTLTISGFVRPAAWYARLAAPVSRYVQRLITRRYLRALRVRDPGSRR